MTENKNIVSDKTSTTKPFHGFANKLKDLGAFAFLITVFMAGVGLSSLNWSSSYTLLQNDLRHSQEDLTRTGMELAQVKSEYAVFREKSMSFNNSNQEKGLNLNLSETKLDSSIQNKRTFESISLGTENTGYLFNREIFISLVATTFEGDPLRHKVIATVGSPGYETIKIDRKDVGYVVRYKANDIYEILVTEANTFSAEFQVLKISDEK